MSMIDPKYENIVFTKDKKLIGNNLNFKYRKEQAKILIDKIFKEKAFDTKKIKNALEYDNTNKSCIYALLLCNKNENKQEEFEKNLKIYKFCITQQFTIKIRNEEKNVDLNDLYKINYFPMKEQEQLPVCKKNEDGNIRDMRNSVVEFFTNYYYIANNITKFEPNLKKEELNKIITMKFAKKLGNNFDINHDNEVKLKILQNAINN